MVDKVGRIITFYSYKGGTGRTMAVSNVAWVLASNGYDVLLIDWDLEAPGLHRYLRPFLVDPELSSTPGLIDFVWEAAAACMTPSPTASVPSAMRKSPSLEDYVVGLDWDFPEKGSLGFIPAGRQDANYAQRVNTFSWDNFYERLGGGKLLHAQSEMLRANYDYILIDSRTGVSDTSGICTVQMPDVLAVFFTLNRQSIKGAAAVAASVRAQRSEKFLPIFPVPTRLENAETDKLAVALAYARRMFEPFLAHVQSNPSKIDLNQQLSYWHDVETPYRTFYAFEEVPAAFKEEAGSRGGLLAANERIAYWISGRVVSSLRPASAELRKAVVEKYAFTEEEARKLAWEPQVASYGPTLNVIWWIRRHVRRILLRYPVISACVAGIAIAVLVLSVYFAGSRSSELKTIRSTLTEVNSQLSDTQKELATSKDVDKTSVDTRLKTISETLNRLLKK